MDIFDNNLPHQNQNDMMGSEAENEQDEKILNLSQQGYQLLKDNNIDEAEACFNQILEYDIHNNYALVGLGDASRKRRDYHGAIEKYKKCLIYYPGNNYALFGLADCYKALHKYPEAIEIWEKYLKHDDTNVTVLTRVADAYRKVRNFKRSRELYLRVLEMEERNAYALIGLGHLHYDFKDFEAALSYWEAMLQDDEENVDIRVLTSLGNCHRKMKTFAQGTKYFLRALEREPNNFYALFGLADCYRGMDEHEESLRYWMKILSRDPNNKVILTRAGDAYRCMGEFENAAEYYHKALNIEYDSYAMLGLALINKEKGNYEVALESLDSLRVKDPNNHRLYIEIAECFVKLGNKDAAIDMLVQFQNRGMRNNQIATMLEQLRAI